MKNKDQLIKNNFVILNIVYVFLAFYQSVFGMTIDESLFSSILSGSIQKVEESINSGANVNIKSNIRPYSTPLHVAAEHGHVEMVRLLLNNGADIEALNQAKETPLCLAASRGHSEVVHLLLEQGANVKILTKNKRNATPLHGAFYFFSKNIGFNHSLDNSFSISNTGFIRSVRKMETDQENVFIELLLWYNYQLLSSTESEYQMPVAHSIQNLMRYIEVLEPEERFSADKTQYFFQVKSLSQWIITKTSGYQSKKEFLKKILDYLLGSHPPEQQNLLKENVKYLLLKNYLLNADNSDFYDLKIEFSRIHEEKLKALENFLRYTYARALKKELFSNFSKEDLKSQKTLEHRLNTLKKQDADIAFFSEIRNLGKLIHPVIKYCNDSSMKLPFKDRILEINRASRITQLVQWIQQYHNSHLAFPWWIDKVYKRHDHKIVLAVQESTFQKEPSAKEIWVWGNYWGGSCIEDSKRLMVSIYKHLEHIIEHKGTRLDSDTPFGRETSMDILKFTR